MELVFDCKLPSKKEVPWFRCLSMLLSLVALLADVLSSVGLLPFFNGGYALTLLDFYNNSAPKLLALIRACLANPALLFVLTHAMILSILLSSGALDALFKGDDPATSATAAGARAAGTAARSDAAAKAETSASSSPPSPATAAAAAAATDASHVGGASNSNSSCLKKSLRRSCVSAPGRSTAPSTKWATAPCESIESYNLVTCEQDVFNEIIERYIYRFRQDMRQQELQSVVNGYMFAAAA